jgi:hypothetical protein
MIRVVLSILVIALPAVSSAAKPRLAILSVRVEAGLAQGIANLLAEILSNDVQQAQRYEVITGSDVVAMLQMEQQKQMLGACNEASCLAELGGALGADLLVDASVGLVGSVRVVSLKLIDVRRAQVLGRHSETVKSDDAMVDAVHRGAAAILAAAPRPSSSEASEMVGVSASGGSKLPLWLLGAAALAGGAGAYLGVTAMSDYDGFKQDPADDALGARAERNGYLADGLFGAALVTAGVAVYLWLTEAPSVQAEVAP